SRGATERRKNSAKPKGGCINEVCIFTANNTPNQIRSIPSLSATGPTSGTMMNASSKKSRKNASKKIRILTKMMNPHSPPGIPINKCSTHKSPLIPRKLNVKTVEPTKIKTTKQESFV